MSHEINIVLGILFFTQKYSLCLHASDEISGSDVDMLLKDFKNCCENSISWFCMAAFPEPSTHMDLCRYPFVSSAVHSSPSF
jgi:hypothetical protein